MMIKPDMIWGQVTCESACEELIMNPELNIKAGATDGNDAYAFPNSLIEWWRCSHGTPHFFGINASNYCYSTTPAGGHNTLDDFPNSITCVSTTSFSLYEGFYQVLKKPVKDDPYLKYTVKIRAGLMPCSGPGNWNTSPGTLVARFANHLNPNATCDNIPPENPVNNPSHVILNEFLTSTDITTFTREFTSNDLNADFNQIWIYGDIGSNTNLGIYDVSMTCSSSALTGINTVSGICDQYTFEPLEARSFESYEWCVNNVKISDSKIFNHTFDQPGTYEVCLKVVDINCCCAQKCVTLEIDCPTPDADFEITGDCPDYQFTVTNPKECNIYNWDFGDGTISGNQNPTHTYANPGTYTVKLKVKNCGQVDEEIKQIEINCVKPSCADTGNCISIGTPGGTVLLSTLLAGPNPVIPHTILAFNSKQVNNLCFSLEGTLVIDVSQVAFLNTTWYCGPGSSISIINFVILGAPSFIDSQFLGCSTMWRGIVLDPNPLGNFFLSSVLLRNTMIYDAYRGVELAGGRSIIAESSSFIDNYVGCYVPANGFNSFTDCRFENTGAMLPPYSGQPQWNQRMHAGIEGVDVTLINVFGTGENSKSLFKNLSYGIKTERSGVSVENSRFEVDDITNVNNRYGAYGIYEKYPNSYSTVSRNYFSSNFRICFYSVDGMMNGIQLSNNQFNLNSSIQSGIGVEIASSNNINLSIHHENTFTIDKNGGRALGINNCTYNNLNIDENIFITDTDSGASDMVSIQSCQPLGSGGLLRENKFHLNKRRDIYITNSPNIVMLRNLYFGESARNLINNSPQVFVKGNINASTGKTSWLSISGSTNAKICCNESNSPTGPALVYLHGGNLNNKIVGNSIKQIYLYHGTVVGTQPSHSNIFDPSSSQVSINEYTPDPNYYQANQFNVDPGQIGNRPGWINDLSMMPLFFPQDGTSTACGNYGICDSDDFDLPFINPDSIPLALTWPSISDEDADLSIVNYINAATLFAHEDYPYRHRHIWENHYNLYKLTQKYPFIDWQTKLNGLEAGNLLSANLTQGMIHWAGVEAMRTGLYAMNESERMTYYQNQKILRNVGALVKDWYADTNQEKDGSLLASLYDQLNEAHQVIIALDDEINTRVQASMPELMAEIDALDASQPFLAERKKVWQIDAIRLMSGLASITNADWEEITRIAALCPLEYGSAVYEAHGLLMAINAANTPYDLEQNCTPEVENRSRSVQRPNRIEVFPNPTTGRIHINLASDPIADQVIVTDLLGQQLYEYAIPKHEALITLDLGHLKPGIYIYNMLSENQAVHTGKLIIID